MKRVLRVVWLTAVVGVVLVLFQSKQQAHAPTVPVERGEPKQLVVQAGMPLWQLLPTIAQELDVPMESLRAAVRDTALMRQLQIPYTARTLEGYLAPGTYWFNTDATARLIVTIMALRFEQLWTERRTERLKNLRMTRHEVMTLASIVQKEIMRPAEGPVVAGVFMNRLERGMRLQADPTVLYALRRTPGRVSYADLRVVSPYNTYLINDLPPGPIGIPSAASVDAVLWYRRHQFLFFVSRGDGTHKFTRTYADHLAAIKRIRTP